MDKKTKDKISAALKKKWASGTRKINPRSGIDQAAETRRQMMADGRMRKRVTTPEQGREYVAKRDYDKMVEINRRIAKGKIGVPMKSPLSAMGEDHHKACYWMIHHKGQGVTLEGKNLNELVRHHSHLFDAADLNWNGKYSCRASKGLRSLFEMNKQTGQPRTTSWKGWTVGDRV